MSGSDLLITPADQIREVNGRMYGRQSPDHEWQHIPIDATVPAWFDGDIIAYHRYLDSKEPTKPSTHPSTQPD